MLVCSFFNLLIELRRAKFIYIFRFIFKNPIIWLLPLTANDFDYGDCYFDYGDCYFDYGDCYFDYGDCDFDYGDCDFDYGDWLF